MEHVPQMQPKDVESEKQEKTIENTQYPFFKGTEKYVELPRHRRDIWPESGLELRGYKRTEIKWEDLKRNENGENVEQVITDVLRVLTRGRVPDNTLYHVYGAWGGDIEAGPEVGWQLLSEEFYDGPKMLKRIHEMMLKDEKREEFTISDFLFKIDRVLINNTAGQAILVEQEKRTKHIDGYNQIVYERSHGFSEILFGLLMIRYKETGTFPQSIKEIQQLENEVSEKTREWDMKTEGEEIEFDGWAIGRKSFKDKKWIDYKDAAEAVFEHIFSGTGNLFYVAPLSVAGKIEKDRFSQWGPPVQENKMTFFFGAKNQLFIKYAQMISEIMKTEPDVLTLPRGRDPAAAERQESRIERWTNTDYQKVDIRPLGTSMPAQDSDDDFHPILPVIHGMKESPPLGWAWAECIYIPTKSGINVISPDVQEKKIRESEVEQ